MACGLIFFEHGRIVCGIGSWSGELVSAASTALDVDDALIGIALRVAKNLPLDGRQAEVGRIHSAIDANDTNRNSGDYPVSPGAPRAVSTLS